MHSPGFGLGTPREPLLAAAMFVPKDPTIPPRRVNPAELEGEALRRWYLRSSVVFFLFLTTCADGLGSRT